MTRSSERDKQILDLFDASLDQPSDRRKAWLAEQAGDDTELLNAVLAMLDLDERDHRPRLAARRVGVARQQARVRFVDRHRLAAAPPEALVRRARLARVLPSASEGAASSEPTGGQGWGSGLGAGGGSGSARGGRGSSGGPASRAPAEGPRARGGGVEMPDGEEEPR